MILKRRRSVAKVYVIFERKRLWLDFRRQMNNVGCAEVLEDDDGERCGEKDDVDHARPRKRD